MMKKIITEIRINAPVSSVWSILIDFQRFPEWNPFITEASGHIEEGTQLKIHIEPPNSSGMTFKPTITKIKQERELRWLGRVLIPGIFDGEHIFELKPINEKETQFVQREKFKGVLVPFLWKSLHKNTRQGFEEMNAALKKRAEQQGTY
ncbi:MAG: SRPBCC domain-containing protein [Balneolaceae bacterium]